MKPDYYLKNGIDVIEAIGLLRGKQAMKDFCIGNVIKYVVRYEKKNGIEDLIKAETYIQRLREIEENEHGDRS